MRRKYSPPVASRDECDISHSVSLQALVGTEEPGLRNI